MRESRSKTSVAILAAALLGALVAQSFTFSVLEVNHLPLLSSDALLLSCLIAAFAGIPVAVGFWLVSVVVRRLLSLRDGNSQHPTDGMQPVAVVAAAMLAAAVLAVFVRADAPFEVARRTIPVLAFLGALPLIAAMLGRRRRGAVVSAACLAALCGLALAVGGGHVERYGFDGAVSTVDVGPRPADGKVVLLGVDGLCWETLQRWADDTDNEDMKWFRANGYVGPLETLEPTESPRIWTSIATGLPPGDHGVLGFTAVDIPGLTHPLSRIPQHQGASLWLKTSERLGVARTRPVGSPDMRRPPFWEMIVSPETPVDVVGWWSTWPAGPLHGRLVTDRFYFFRRDLRGDTSAHEALTYPPQLERELEPLRVPPQSMTAEQIMSFIDIPRAEAEALTQGLAGGEYEHHQVLSELPLAYTMDETYYAVSRRFLGDSTDSAVLALYFRGIDLVSHAALGYSNLYPEAGASDEQRRRYGELVSRYYTYTMRKLRELVELAGPDARVIVVSDHGFSRADEALYAHDDAPPGVVMVLGRDAARRRPLDQPHIYDVAPTLLWLIGYPVARDMPGRPLQELFADLEMASVASVSSYGGRVAPGMKAAATGEVDAQMIELLRSLGYVE